MNTELGTFLSTTMQQSKDKKYKEAANSVCKRLCGNMEGMSSDKFKDCRWLNWMLTTPRPRAAIVHS